MRVVEFFENGLYANWAKYILTLIIVVAVFLFRRSKKAFNLAPGPKGYPILGHLPLLGRNAHIKLDEYYKIFGPIFSIRFGRKYGVVVGDFDLIKETYKMEGLSDRVSELFNFSPKFDTLSQLNGDLWQSRRRFAFSVLRGANRERTTEDIIEEEVIKLLENIEKRDLSQDINLEKLLIIPAGNIPFSILCGKSFAEDDLTMKMLMKFNADGLTYLQWLALVEGLGIPKFVYRYFSKVKLGLEIVHKMDDFFRNEIEEHERTLNPANPRDFIDLALIDMQKPDGQQKTHDYKSIRGDCQVLLMAGTDTSCLTLEWCCLLLVKYPSIQERIYEEIVSVIGERRPTWADHQRLPYLQAFLMEIHRVYTIVPINLIRRAPRDIKIKEYDVPEGSWLFFNYWSVHHDPNLWKNPETFDPTRFLNEDGTKAIEPEFWVSFSFGKRNCIGDKVARMEMFITVASIIQRYHLHPATKGVSLEEVTDLTCKPMYPEVKFQKRTKSVS